MARIKPTNVKIVEITSDSDGNVYGLGNDQIIYRWSRYDQEWQTY